MSSHTVSLLAYSLFTLLILLQQPNPTFSQQLYEKAGNTINIQPSQASIQNETIQENLANTTISMSRHMPVTKDLTSQKSLTISLIPTTSKLYKFNLLLGTPSQTLTLLLQTTTTDSWILSSDCTNVSCHASPHKFDWPKSGTFHIYSSTPLHVAYSDGSFWGYSAHDQITTGGGKNIKLNFIQVYRDQQLEDLSEVDGVLGLSRDINSITAKQTILNTLKNDKIIEEKSFSLDLTGDTNPTLTLGKDMSGYDYKASISLLNQEHENEWMIPLNRLYLGQVKIQLSSSSAVIDTGIYNIGMPLKETGLIDLLINNYGCQRDIQSTKIECPCAEDVFPPLKFTLGHWSVDLPASSYLSKTADKHGFCRVALDYTFENHWRLGTVILSLYPLSIQADQSTLKIASNTLNPETKLEYIANLENDEESDWKIAVIIGLGCTCGALLLALVGLGGYYAYKHCMRQEQSLYVQLGRR